MSATVSYDVSGSVAVIELNAPPVNSLGLELRRSIMNALRRAIETASVGAIVLIGSKRAFSGGADVRELGTPRVSQEPSLRTITRLVEDCTKPVVAAIGGACMGGGFELALACHFRVAEPDAAMALPEVRLGIMPGAGGTQRLPRAAGLEIALDMILTGRTIRADGLRSTGVFDEIVSGDLRGGALAFAERVLHERRPLKRLRDVKVQHPRVTELLATAEAQAAQALKGQPAPLKCAQAVAATLGTPFDDGLALESRLCDWLIGTPESKALRHVFAAERAAGKAPGASAETPVRAIRQVGIIGASPIGCGIAMCCLDAGLAVVLVESDRAALERGMDAILSDYERSVAHGDLDRAARDRRLAALRAAPESLAIMDCDLVIEAAAQTAQGRRSAFEELPRHARQGAILASGDSYADLNRIAAATGRPQDVVGLHFFAPARTTRVVEVARHEKTGADVLATCLAFAKRLNKIAVICTGHPGLIGDRLRHRFLTAAESLLSLGATPQQIDRALTDFGMAAGPFRTGEMTEVSPALPTMKEDADSAVLDDSQIVERCVHALANEGARILQDGIALRSSDIDLVCIHACGFPPYRGGPMHYANEAGLATHTPPHCL